MLYRLALSIFILFILVLTSCSSTQPRADDAAPPPQDVATAVSAAPAQPAADASIDDAFAPQPENQPVVSDEIVVAFDLSGGIAGFCDNLTVLANGNYILDVCGQEQFYGTLEQPDIASVQTWFDNLESFQISTQDNPGGADNLSTNLTFTGQGNTQADQNQQQVMFDWANAMVVRVRPQPAAEVPAPEVAPAANGLCPEISRPALMLINFENPNMITVSDPNSDATCDITFNQPPAGRLVSVGNALYYPLSDPATKSVKVWRLADTGEQTPLDFTSVTMEERAPYDFIVSEDGTKIAWSHSEIDATADPPLYKNSLFVANSDGSDPVTIMDAVENSEQRFLSLVRFDTANNLYYALQPDIGGPIYAGRYDSLYSVPAGGNQAQLVYACPTEENPACIGGLAFDGNALTVVQPDGTLQILNRDGAVLNTVPLPATDYVERTVFSSNGDFAFVSATLTQPATEEEQPMPNPGIVTRVVAPYTEPPQTVLSNNSVGTLWGWLDDTRLVVGTINPEGGGETSVVMLDGQVSTVSPNFAVGVLR